MSDGNILAELVRVQATFQLRAISAAMGIPFPLAPTPGASSANPQPVIAGAEAGADQRGDGE